MITLDLLEKKIIGIYITCIIASTIIGVIYISKGDFANSAYAFSVSLCLIIFAVLMLCFLKFDSIMTKRNEMINNPLSV